MKGLVIKDIINLKQQVKVYLFIIAMWIVLAVVNKDPSFFSCIICTFILLIPISALAYDEKAKWDKFALTMPVSPIEVVASKYVLSILLALAVTIFSIVFNLFTVHDIVFSVFLPIVLNFGVLIVVSIILPIMFKFGVEKGRFLMMLVVLIPVLFFAFVSMSDLSFLKTVSIENFAKILAIVVPLAAILILVISIFVSYKLFKTKEF